MPEKTLIRTRSVLHLNPALADNGCQVFESEHEEDPADEHRSIAVAVPDEMWHDMGDPLVVTASVEPGDLLNDEAAA